MKKTVEYTSEEVSDILRQKTLGEGWDKLQSEVRLEICQGGDCMYVLTKASVTIDVEDVVAELPSQVPVAEATES